jgi:hypothetical protein
MILTDNQRADDLAYMPNLAARVIAKSATFTQARVETSGCAPDRAAILTGCYTHNHQVGLANSTADYYNFCRYGKSQSGRWYGPWENEPGSTRGTATQGSSGGAATTWTSAGVATFPTVTAHGYVVGQHIELTGCVPAAWNARYVIVAVANTTSFQAQAIDGAIQTNPGPVTTNGTFREDQLFSTGSLPNWLKAPKDITNTAIVTGRRTPKTAFVGKYQNGYGDTDTIGSSANPQTYVPPGWDYWCVVVGDTTAPPYNGGASDAWFYWLNEQGTVTFYSYRQQISAATWAGSVATFTLGNDHHLETGDSVVIEGCTPSAWNGTYTATVTGPRTFTVPIASNPGTLTNTTPGGGTGASGALAYPSSLHQCILLSRKIRDFIRGLDPSDDCYVHFCPKEPGDNNSAGDGRRREYRQTISTDDAFYYQGARQAISPTAQPAVTGWSYTAGTLTVTAPGHGLGNIGNTVNVAIRGLAGCNPWVPTQDVTAPTVAATIASANTITISLGSTPGNGGVTSGGAGGVVFLGTRLTLWQWRQEMLRSFDDAIPIICDVLEERSFGGGTIAYTSDNGEAMMEHGAWLIGYAWEEAVRVPFYIRNRRWAPGSTFTIPVGTIDWPLTVLDLFGMTTHHAHTTRDGRSLLRVTDPADSSYERAMLLDNDTQAIVTRQLQKEYISGSSYVSGSNRRFDLSVDPSETAPLTVGSSPDGRTLASRLTTLISCQGDTCRSA